MLSTRITWPATRSRVPASPRVAAGNGIGMSTFVAADDQLGAHKASATNAAYVQGAPPAWSPPV
jgi:hypothetical protein